MLSLELVEYLSFSFLFFNLFLKLEGGWMLEASLQYNYNIGSKENEARLERFHFIGRFFPDH